MSALPAMPLKPDGSQLFTTHETALDYGDVDLIPREGVTSINPEEVDLSFTLKGAHSGNAHIEKKIGPFIIANMRFITVNLAKTVRRIAEEMGEAPPLVCIPKDLTENQIKLIIEDLKETNGNTNIAISFGPREVQNGKAFELIDRIQNESGYNIPFIRFDQPNGYNIGGLEALEKIREYCKEALILGGNTVTPQGAEATINLGADYNTTGIGSGALCTTRTVAGVGEPQMTANYKSAQGIGRHLGDRIVGDGGIRPYDKSGALRSESDIVKALASGSIPPMFGTAFGGHDECFEIGEKPVFVDGEGHPYSGHGIKFMRIAGSASHDALKDNGQNDLLFKDAEGRASLEPYKGSVETLIRALYTTARNNLAALGARNIDELRANVDMEESFKQARKNLEKIDYSQGYELDDVSVVPCFGKSSHAPDSRAQVDLTAQMGTVAMTPLIFRPDNFESLENAAHQIDGFNKCVNRQLRIDGLEEAHPAIIIPSHLAAEAFTQASRGHAFASYPNLWEQVSAGQTVTQHENIKICGYIVAADADVEKTVADIRAFNPLAFIAVAGVETAEQVQALENLSIQGVTISQKEGENGNKNTVARLMQVGPEAEKAGLRVIFDGAIHHPSDSSKALVMGSDAVMIDVPKAREGEDHGQDIFKWFRSITAGMRSMATYVGADNVEDLRRNAQFVPVPRLVNHTGKTAANQTPTPAMAA